MDCKNFKPHSDTEKAVQMTTLLFVSVLGLFGNIFTIVLAAKYTVRRNLHFLIINMALSDTLMIFFLVFYAIGFYYFGIWSHYLDPGFDCRAIPFLAYSSQTVSLVTLVIISVERYRISRRRAVQVSRPYSTKQRVRLLAFSWLISVGINVYEVIFKWQRQDSCGVFAIGNFSGFWILYLTKLAITLLMFLLLVSLSIVTLRRLSNPRAIEDNLSDVQRNLRRQRMRSAVKMVLFSVLLYCFCYLPLLVIRILFKVPVMYVAYFLFKRPFTDDCSVDFRVIIWFAQFFFPILNSSLSPCVYFAFLSDFREAAKTLLCRRNTPPINCTTASNIVHPTVITRGL